jgi:hypothetical protein
MAEAGSIEVALRARIDRLEADLRKAETATKNTSRKMTANFKSVGNSLKRVKGNAAAATAVIVGLGTGAMANLARQAIRTANDLGDIAQKLGISSSALQEFQYAAQQSGVATNTLNMGLQRFGRRAAEAAQGTGEAKDAIKQLGIQLHDSNGNLRSTEDLFTDALNAIAKVPSELERNRLAFKLFDSEGVGIVNMAGNFEQLRERARELGLVLDDELIEKSDHLQDRLDELAQITKNSLAPALTDLGGNALVAAAEAMATLASWADAVYVRFADINALSARQLTVKLNDLNELNAADSEMARAARRSGSIGEAETIELRMSERRTQMREISELRTQLTEERRNRSKPAATGGGSPTKVKTKAQLEAEERALAAAIKRRQNIQNQAHIEYLEAMGREADAIRFRLELDKKALLEGVEDREAYNDTIAEMEATAKAKIADLRAEELADQEDNLEELKDAYADLYDFMERGFSDALATMLLDGEITFKALAQSFLREFVQIGTGALVRQGLGALTNIFSGGGGGLLPGTNANEVFLGTGAIATANGGARLGGAPLLVGERGPELFIPGTSGFVANNNALRKMGGAAVSPVNVTVINNSGQESRTSERDGPGGQRDIEVMIGAAISKNISRGGDVDQAIRNSYGVQRVGRHGL